MFPSTKKAIFHSQSPRGQNTQAQQALNAIVNVHELVATPSAHTLPIHHSSLGFAISLPPLSPPPSSLCPCLFSTAVPASLSWSHRSTSWIVVSSVWPSSQRAETCLAARPRPQVPARVQAPAEGRTLHKGQGNLSTDLALADANVNEQHFIMTTPKLPRQT